MSLKLLFTIVACLILAKAAPFAREGHPVLTLLKRDEIDDQEKAWIKEGADQQGAQDNSTIVALKDQIRTATASLSDLQGSNIELNLGKAKGKYDALSKFVGIGGSVADIRKQLPQPQAQVVAAAPLAQVAPIAPTTSVAPGAAQVQPALQQQQQLQPQAILAPSQSLQIPLPVSAQRQKGTQTQQQQQPSRPPKRYRQEYADKNGSNDDSRYQDQPPWLQYQNTRQSAYSGMKQRDDAEQQKRAYQQDGRYSDSRSTATLEQYW